MQTAGVSYLEPVSSMSQRPRPTATWIANEVITLIAVVAILAGLALLLLGSLGASAAVAAGWLTGDVAAGFRLAGKIVAGLGTMLWVGVEALSYLIPIGPPPVAPTPHSEESPTGAEEARASERSN